MTNPRPEFGAAAKPGPEEAHVTAAARSVDRDILIVVGVFVVIMTLHLYISFTGLEVLSWTRSYVAAEGIWSRSQKDAVIALHQYALSGNEADFLAYRRAIAIPFANRLGRQELERSDPNMDAAFRAFVEGGNHPKDVTGFTAAIRGFRRIGHIDQALEIWTQADRLIDRLDALAERLHRQIRSTPRDSALVRATLDEIGSVNLYLTRLESLYSATLGQGARWLKRIIMSIALLTTVLLVTGGVMWSAIMSRRIRKTQGALLWSEAKYRSLVDRAAYGIYRSTIDGRFLAVNPALVEMLGYRSVEDVLALSLEHDLYLYPDDRARLIMQHVESEQIEGVEVEWRRRDGIPIMVRLSGKPSHDDAGVLIGFEMIVEDITERRVLEEQLRQSQKMEAVGQLTGGIAHDLNNILTVILANADLLAVPPKGTTEAREGDMELGELREAARRGAAMIRKLLAFSRREKLSRASVDLGTLVGETIQVLRRLLPESIEIVMATDESLPTVLADAGSVEQILVNLATNARDAMPNGGRLRIEVRSDEIDEQFVAWRGWGRPGNYVTVRVSDTGTGMTADTRQRVFEPFFTTKAPGSGTGLGMAMIYGLLKQHDGFVDIESELGVGTTVTTYFPIGGVSGPLASGRQPLLGSLPRGTETILVVEDEAAIRSAVRRGLERLGYRVLLASDGQDGLNIFRLMSQEIELVLTDVVMPKMTGTQLYDALLLEQPDVKVMFMSGYTLRDGVETTSLDPSVPLVRKPWTLGQLASQIRETLDQAAVPLRT